MTQLPRLIGVALVALCCACVQTPTDQGASPPAEPGGEAQAPGEGAPPIGEGQEQPAVTVEKASELVKGEWALQLSPTQQRQYELLELAFRDPLPTEADLDGMELSAEERLTVGMVIMGREQHPDGAAQRDVLQGLDELASATLTVTADTIDFAHGEHHDLASYSVVSEESSSLLLETTSTTGGEAVVETVHVELDGADHLTIWADGDAVSARQSFARRRAEGEDAAAQDAGGDSAPAPEAPPEGQP